MTAKLLLVDDNENFIKLLKIALEHEKYEVDTADCGLKALAIMKTRTYNWVISDIQMDLMDGIEMAQNIKESYPQTKILLMTAFEADPAKIKSLRVEGFLEKPVSAEDICGIITGYKDK